MDFQKRWMNYVSCRRMVAQKLEVKALLALPGGFKATSNCLARKYNI